MIWCFIDSVSRFESKPDHGPAFSSKAGWGDNIRGTWDAYLKRQFRESISYHLLVFWLIDLVEKRPTKMKTKMVMGTRRIPM